MKRSDMLKIMEDCIILGRIYELSSRETVEKMLYIMEDHGMLPPEVRQDFSDRSTNDLAFISEWEPEGEK